MSRIEQPQPSALIPRIGTLRTAGMPSIECVTGSIGRLFQSAWANRPLRVAVVWGVAAWILLMGTFVAWVHFSLEGVAHRALLPSTYFGLPRREAAAGFGTVSKFGYDGQQYYWISNDVFGRFDAVKHLDEPLYRYQRIGIPLLAGSLATLLGYPLTPTPLYFAIEFAMTAAGFGGLVYWLASREMPPFYALGWLLSAGTLFALWVGTVDSPADSLLIFSILAVFARRLAWYVPLATLMLLTRETYSVYAFSVFIVTAFGKLDWKETRSYFGRLALTALPGAVMLGWTIYLTLHFQMSPLAARSNPGMKDWPFRSMLEFAGFFFQRNDWSELRMLIVTAFSLILVAVVALRNFRHLPLALACAVPLVLLNASTGRAIWESSGGSMRLSGSIIILGLFLMSIDKTVLLKFMLVLQMVVGLDVHAAKYLMSSRIFSPSLIHEEAGFVGAQAENGRDNVLINDPRSSVEWINPQRVCRHEYQGPWSPVHREIKVVRVVVTNRGNVAWEPGIGKHSILVGCRVFNADQSRVLSHRCTVLGERIAPGETKVLPALLELRQPNRQYVVQFSLFQNGAGWFADSDPSFGSRYEVTVE